MNTESDYIHITEPMLPYEVFRKSIFYIVLVNLFFCLASYFGQRHLPLTYKQFDFYNYILSLNNIIYMYFLLCLSAHFYQLMTHNVAKQNFFLKGKHLVWDSIKYCFSMMPFYISPLIFRHVLCVIK